MLFAIILSYALLASVYDLRHSRVPNWVTLPVLVAGLIAGFPGNPGLWAAFTLLAIAWRHGVIGGGDVKLWMAIILVLPLPGWDILINMMLVFGITGFMQIANRKMRGKGIAVRSPGAWRVIGYVLLWQFLGPSWWLFNAL